MINEAVCQAWEKIEEIKDKFKKGASIKACEKAAKDPLKVINDAGRKRAENDVEEYTDLTFKDLIK